MTGYGVLVDRTDFEAHMRSGATPASTPPARDPS
jgi:hypothetical protein